ncbi:hypothetical protein IWX49DRAFT_257849 [Phyllosticta citricarpa]|uniref:Uncharacterized protein n=2 Tax=Phyllosticta TaxID=121621 RepID=A0ABR1LPC6_9PEZI
MTGETAAADSSREVSGASQTKSNQTKPTHPPQKKMNSRNRSSVNHLPHQANRSNEGIHCSSIIHHPSIYKTSNINLSVNLSHSLPTDQPTHQPIHQPIHQPTHQTTVISSLDHHHHEMKQTPCAPVPCKAQPSPHTSTLQHCNTATLPRSIQLFIPPSTLHT